MKKLFLLIPFQINAAPRTLLLVLATCFALATSSLSAQESWTSVLLPIAVGFGPGFGPVQGANGSLWITEIVARNNGSQDAQFFYSKCVVFCDHYENIRPNTTIPLTYYNPRGRIVIIRSAEAAGIVFSIRVRDLSRQSETWGTEIPAVPESAAFTTTAHFLNIPTSNDFRALLRIYDFTDAPNRQFSVKVLPLAGNSVLKEIMATTTMVPFGVAETEIANLIPSLAGDAIRLEVTPLTEGKFWAFVSVTNNATQHVTLVTQRQ